MLQTLFNWLKFDIQSLIPEVWWCVLILWCVLLILAFIDVASNSLRPISKAAWMAGILLLPFAGLFAYCVFSLFRADYYMLDFLTKRKKTLPNRKIDTRNLST